MRTILSSRRHHYLKRVGIFLIVIALVAGIAGCTAPATYDLTMAADPAGGGTATDRTNGSPYEEGAAVGIRAVAAAGYQFAGWTAPAGTFADANAEETNFDMPAQDVTVTANFEPMVLDHFRAYGIGVGPGPAGMPYVGEVVCLEDQFGAFTATVGWGMAFVNPVEKVHGNVTTPISNPDHHSMGYGLEGVEPQWWRVTVSNQFGTQELTVVGPIGLSVPTQKEGHGEPVGLDCFLSYEIIDPPSVEVVVNLSDQFCEEQNVLVTQAKAFANPVRMIYDGEVTEILNPNAHGVSYWTLAEGLSMEQHEVVLSNQFGEYTFNVTAGDVIEGKRQGVLSVPSEKIDWEPIPPPLDHFRCYNASADTMPYVGEVVELKDQFGSFTATVGLGTTLCNPVDKGIAKLAASEWVPISHPDYHLMLYMLEGVEPHEWVVEGNNQFGDQKWTVSGPAGLAVPTRKDPHGEPVGLDYFLLYEVIESPPMDVIVDLTDEFGGGDNNFKMVEPFAYFFGNPVQITHDGEVTGIVNPDDHLVFYYVRSEFVSMEWHEVVVTNLFGEYTLNVMEGEEALLAVPSEERDWYAS